jgi:uncharacterized membrane protein
MTDRSTPKPRARSPFSPSRATGRLLISATLGAIAFVWLTPSRIEWPIRAIAGWDVASLALLAFAWTIILRADATETRRRAAGDDPGRHMVFFIVVVASLISLFAPTVVLPKVRAFQPGEEAAWTLLTLAAVVLSWVVTHTAYTFRYAHLHYRRSGPRDDDAAGGLKFCGTEEPLDIDFAYFAFTIGMCFQVSDVVVTSTRMRREVLGHAVLSFVYTTVILALALNLVFNLMSSATPPLA